MYPFVSKLAEPLTLLLLGTILATALLWRPPRLLRQRYLVALTIAVGLLTLICLPPVGSLAVLSLEWPYPPLERLPKDVDTIVVLSGSLRIYDRTGQHVELGPDTLYRCLEGARLYQQADGCRVVVTGGRVEDERPGPALAVAMRDFLVRMGVRPEDILTEDGARSTYENAVNTRELLRPLDVDRVALVTDATHMNRASRCFRAQGIEVVPAACNHRVGHVEWSLQWLLPDASSASGVQLAAHEWLGLIWYWLHGRI